MNPSAYGGRGSGRGAKPSRQSGGNGGGTGGGGGCRSSKKTMFGAVIVSVVSIVLTLAGCGPKGDPPRPTDTPTVMYTVILPPQGALLDGGIYDNN